MEREEVTTQEAQQVPALGRHLSVVDQFIRSHNITVERLHDEVEPNSIVLSPEEDVIVAVLQYAARVEDDSSIKFLCGAAVGYGANKAEEARLALGLSRRDQQTVQMLLTAIAVSWLLIVEGRVLELAERSKASQ